MSKIFKPRMTYQKLLQQIRNKAIPLDKSRFDQVYKFAKTAHQGKVRYSGESSITHPLFVANTLATWNQSQTVLEAALLHDIVDTTPIMLNEIIKRFGTETAFLVDGVTRVGNVKLRGNTNVNFLENLREMFLAMANDIRVVLIRLADRHHNMLTLDAVPLSKQHRIAMETLEIYAPLAERLGMGQIKGELEDLAFPYAYPEEHAWILEIAEKHFQTAKQVTTKAIKVLSDELIRTGIKATVHGRPKNKYSLYKKLLRPEIDRDIAKIHDLIALRVITGTKADCYASLGIAHSLWKPVPHLGVSDFIAQPKPNGYRSIHTKVFDHSGQIIEIQIRTNEMQQVAELGHILYSEAKNQGVKGEILERGVTMDNKKINMFQLLLDWQKEASGSKEYITDLKLDILSQHIYIFSPKGDIFDLPFASTPVDFAFAVHGDLGFHIQAAKVNQKIVSLNFPLKNGDVVEIIRSKNKRLPTRGWLQFIKSARARHQIRKELGIK